MATKTFEQKNGTVWIWEETPELKKFIQNQEKQNSESAKQK